MRSVAAAIAPLATERRFLTFRLATRLYALPAELVREVIHLPAVARVPQGPPALRGIANLRGTVLPLVGLKELLQPTQPAGESSATKAIVLAERARPVALAVDAVESLASIAAERIEVRESEVAASAGERLDGAFELGDGGEVAKILDIDGLLGAAFSQHARPQRQASAAREQRAIEKPAEAAAAPTMLVTFEVAGQEFGLELTAVQEILPAPASISAVPRAESLVLGVTALRNRLLPLLSLRGLLGFPPAAAQSGFEKVIVLRVRGAQVGLVADRATAVLAAEPSAIDPVPTVLAARTGGEAKLKAIYRADQGRRLISILMPEQLFREDVMRRVSEETKSAQSRAAPLEPTARADRQFLVFSLADGEFALPIDCVDEVREVPPQITRLPKTPKFLEGVVNLRGDVLPVVDQRRRFEMPPRSPTDRRRLVVVRTERHRAGLIVDDVSDVLRVPAHAVESPPDLNDEIGRLVRGVLNLEASRRIVLVLDPAELLTRAERGRLDAFRKTTRAEA